MKRSFFQAAVVSILQYGCTTWTLTKRLKKKLDDSYTRMLRAILNKSWQQHPARHQLYSHLPPITKTIQVRWTRHAGHCWRSKDELISDVLLWTPTYGQAKAGRPARAYIQQLFEDTDVALETCQKRWMIGRSGERGSRISVLGHDMMMMTYIYIYVLEVLYLERKHFSNFSLLALVISYKIEIESVCKPHAPKSINRTGVTHRVNVMLTPVLIVKRNDTVILDKYKLPTAKETKKQKMTCTSCSSDVIELFRRILEILQDRRWVKKPVPSQKVERVTFDRQSRVIYRPRVGISTSSIRKDTTKSEEEYKRISLAPRHFPDW